MTGMVMAFPKAGIFGGPFNLMPGRLNPDGTFTISGLTPGDYTLQVQSQSFGDAASADYAALDIVIGGSDITGIRLTASKPSNGSGRVVFSDPGAAQSLRSGTLRLMSTPVSPGLAFSPMIPASLNEDWTFQMKLRPGPTRIDVTGQPAGWVVKAVRHRGIDVREYPPP